MRRPLWPVRLPRSPPRLHNSLPPGEIRRADNSLVAKSREGVGHRPGTILMDLEHEPAVQHRAGVKYQALGLSLVEQGGAWLERKLRLDALELRGGHVRRIG